METRTNWGIVVVASVFALLAIGVAASTAYLERGSGASVIADLVTNQGEPGDWRQALALIATSTVDAEGNYTAPKELSTTEALSRELFIKYVQLKKGGTLSAEDIESSVNELLQQNINPVVAERTYNLGSLKINSALSMDAYAGALGAALGKSIAVKEYELTSFARAVGRKDYNGTPELVKTATLYAEIEQNLATMQVPQSVAAEHLVLLQNISLLAHTTHLLATWSGDPIEAMGYVDAFAKVERSVQVSITRLFTAMNKAGA